MYVDRHQQLKQTYVYIEKRVDSRLCIERVLAGGCIVAVDVVVGRFERIKQ